MQPVECLTCGNRVLCEKFTLAHISIQWTAEAAKVCPEIRARVVAGECGGRVRACGALRASIDRAVDEGLLEVIDA